MLTWSKAAAALAVVALVVTLLFPAQPDGGDVAAQSPSSMPRMVSDT